MEYLYEKGKEGNGVGGAMVAVVVATVATVGMVIVDIW